MRKYNIYEDIGDSLQVLTKNQLASFLNIELTYKTKKDELITQVKEIITDNEVMFRKFYKEYKKYFSLKPQAVEELLNITKTERTRWTKEGKFEIIGHEEFRSWGKTLKVNLFDRIQIYTLSKETIESWRKEYEDKKKQNHKKGLVKAKETKIKNNFLREDFKKKFKEKLVEWHKINLQMGATFELAYWTMWVSRWAKEYHSKALNPNSRKKQEYFEKEEMFYQLKNTAIFYLLKSEYKKVGFYEPEYPHKISVKYCNKHYSKFNKVNADIDCFNDYIPTWQFAHNHLEEIKSCTKCDCIIQENYYSLFYLSIQNTQINYNFSFHTPYEIGKSIFPNINDLDKVEHQEQEGIFRFGRTLFEDEKVIYTEKFVLKQFNNALNKFKIYYDSPQKR